MHSNSPNTISTELREFFHSKLGLFYTERHDEELLHKLKHAAKAFGCSGTKQFTEWLISHNLTDKQTGDLASYLTIGETYFFREKKSFDFLEQIYLPGLVRRRYDSERHLSIWCAGCATGEEAYSLAISISRSIPDIKLWNITILATDINQIFLEKAKCGIYTKWSFRTNGEVFKHKYFTKVGPVEFQILPDIRRMVKFSWMNLVSENYPSHIGMSPTFDIIFCRNVLIYFSPQGHRQVTGNFYNSLVKGGILVVSPVEMMGVVNPKFSKIFYSGFTIFLKGTHHRSENISISDSGVKMPDFDSSIELAKCNWTQDKPILPPSCENTPTQIEYLPKEIPLVRKDFELAESLFRLGDFQEAEAVLSGLLELRDSDTKSLLLMAKITANQGRLKEAEQLCKKGILQDKLDQNFYYLLATILQELGQDEQAVSILEQALYIDPDFVLASFLLGSLNLKLGYHDEGMTAFKRATSSLSRLDPESLLPESDGITVARFSEIINTVRK